MPDLGQAIQQLNEAASALAKSAKKYEEARKAQDEAHSRTQREWKAWQKDPSERNVDDLREAQSEENTAVGDAQQAGIALEGATKAFNRALANFLNALAQVMLH